MARRPGQSIPKYRKHRASGQAVVTINGRDHYLGPHGTKASKLEYDRLIGEWLADGRSATFGAHEQVLTLVEVLADYLGFAKKRYGDGPKSEYQHMRRLCRPLKEMYGRAPAQEFGPLKFQAVRQRLIDEGCSRTYVNSSMRRVARIFRWAVATERVPASVGAALKAVEGLRRGETKAPETEPITPVESDIVEATIPFLPPVVSDMVSLQRLTGARPAEVCMLRPCNLDRSGEVWEYRVSRHKTAHHGRSRIVMIGPRAQAILLRYLVRNAEACCFRPSDSEEKRLANLHAMRKTPLCCGNRL